jgi:catechol 2,3-dioxygenase-like lactoylglutathione lyase family enzyme
MTAVPFAGLGPIGQVMIPVRSTAVSVPFYRDALGMRFLFEFPHMAFFDADGIRLYLAEPDNPDFRGTATIYYRVPDIAAAFEALRSRGVPFTDEPHVVHRDGTTATWMCFAKDPDGNNIGVMSEVPDAG